MICENSSSGTGRVVSPQCYMGTATKKVMVVYTKSDWGDDDMLFLCAECAKRLEKDARRHGCSVSVESIKERRI